MKTHQSEGYLVEIERIVMRGAFGSGLSDSSVRYVLEATGALCRDGHWPIDPEAVIMRALEAERARARGRCVGTDDVVPIVRGGAVEVRTFASGGIASRPISVDADFVRRHLLFGFNPHGQRHHVPDLLASLFAHPRARAYVEAISEAAVEACAALERGEMARLAACVRVYRKLFRSWSDGRVVNRAFARMASRLQDALGGRLLAANSPGAGGAESLVALVERDAMGEAIEILAQAGWSARPVEVSEGLTGHVSRDSRTVRFTAPHRIDLVGAADLGQDPSIGADGVCCSLAIEPRCELRMTFPPPNRGSFSRR